MGGCCGRAVDRLRYDLRKEHDGERVVLQHRLYPRQPVRAGHVEAAHGGGFRGGLVIGAEVSGEEELGDEAGGQLLGDLLELSLEGEWGLKGRVG